MRIKLLILLILLTGCGVSVTTPAPAGVYSELKYVSVAYVVNPDTGVFLNIRNHSGYTLQNFLVNLEYLNSNRMFESDHMVGTLNSGDVYQVKVYRSDGVQSFDVQVKCYFDLYSKDTKENITEQLAVKIVY